MIRLALSAIIVIILSCELQSQELVDNSVKQSQESIIEEHLKNGAHQYSFYSKEWKEEIDKGLAKDSTIAYLWCRSDYILSFLTHNIIKL